MLGEGKTAKVYRLRNIKDGQLAALKLLKDDFQENFGETALHFIRNEIKILKGLNSKRVVKLLGYGSEGTVVKRSGRKIENLVFILLEYAPHILYDLNGSLEHP